MYSVHNTDICPFTFFVIINLRIILSHNDFKTFAVNFDLNFPYQ